MAVYEVPPAISKLPSTHPAWDEWTKAHPLVVKGDKWIMSYAAKCCGGVVLIEHSGTRPKYDVIVEHLDDCPEAHK